MKSIRVPHAHSTFFANSLISLRSMKTSSHSAWSRLATGKIYHFTFIKRLSARQSKILRNCAGSARAITKDYMYFVSLRPREGKNSNYMRHTHTNGRKKIILAAATLECPRTDVSVLYGNLSNVHARTPPRRLINSMSRIFCCSVCL